MLHAGRLALLEDSIRVSVELAFVGNAEDFVLERDRSETRQMKNKVEVSRFTLSPPTQRPFQAIAPRRERLGGKTWKSICKPGDEIRMEQFL